MPMVSSCPRSDGRGGTECCRGRSWLAAQNRINVARSSSNQRSLKDGSEAGTKALRILSNLSKDRATTFDGDRMFLWIGQSQNLTVLLLQRLLASLCIPVGRRDAIGKSNFHRFLRSHCDSIWHSRSGCPTPTVSLGRFRKKAARPHRGGGPLRYASSSRGSFEIVLSYIASFMPHLLGHC